MKLFASATPEVADSEYALPLHAPDDLRREYERLIRAQVERMHVQEIPVHVDVCALGAGEDGLPSFGGMLRIDQWNRKAAVRMLVGLPLLERKVAQSLAATWLGEVSHFEGLWLRAAGELQGKAAMTELRDVVLTLERSERLVAVRGESSFSLPPGGDSQFPRR